MGLYLDCPVWSYKGWVGDFFPPGTKPAEFLREYARRLNTVEGNTTFYAVPTPETLARWVAQTPDTFHFCPKIPRHISHAGRLEPRLAEAAEFVDAMSGLGARLGPVFLQLPPRYSPALRDDVRRFLEAWPPATRLAVEVRHPDWFDTPHQGALEDLLSEHTAARVVIDTRPIRALSGDGLLEGSVYQRMLEARARKPDLPVEPVATGPFVFLRYIGHPQLEANAAFIQEWARQMAPWLQAGRDVYIFCHCPDETLDPWLCRRFHQAIRARVAVPPLPWDAADAGVSRQGRLF